MTNRINNFFVLILLIIGMFFPTSLNGVINKNLELAQYIILIFILLGLFFFNPKKKKGLLFAFLTMFIILFSTATTIFMGKYANVFFTGVFLQYILLSLLFVVDLSKIKLNVNFEKIFFLFNIVVVVIGFLVVLDFPEIKVFLMNNYSSFYDELLSLMFLNNKPVFVFGTHSLASLFYYLFFYIDLKIYISKKKNTYLLFGIFFMILMFFLRSMAAYILLLLALCQLLYYLSKKSLPLLYFLLIIIFITVFKQIEIIQFNIDKVINSDISGFAGRYSSDGALSVTLEYISQNLNPIGIVNVPNLYYTDSGWVMNILRGSILLFVVIYLGFYSFLKSNLSDKKVAKWLFIVIFAFELGFQGLTYIRMLYFLPFLIVYMNNFASKTIK